MKQLKIIIITISILLVASGFVFARYYEVPNANTSLSTGNNELTLIRDKEVEDFIDALKQKVPMMKINEDEFGKKDIFN